MKEDKIILPPDAKGGVSITPPQGCEVSEVGGQASMFEEVVGNIHEKQSEHQSNE